jgi:Leucine-rich repeat (LRR) protein
MPNLEWIKMEENLIESIEPGAFICLTKIKLINMSFNLLEQCPSLSELASLEKLNLRSNKIKSVDELFDGMERDAMNTKLRVLDLSENEIASLSADVFSRLASLTCLDLRDNSITAVPNGAFNGLLNLKSLDLANDGIKSIDFSIFDSDLANLIILNLPWDLKAFEVNGGSLATKSFKHFRNQLIVDLSSYRLEVGGSILDDLKESGVIYSYKSEKKK